jgi:plasmid rolling circle replication initiator protein Rep
MQEDKILRDVTKKGKEQDWRTRKISSLLLSESYKRLGEPYKSQRVFFCGCYLEFRKYEDGSQQLHNANFCKGRICPMCSWRRSLKVFGQVSKVMDYITIDNDYRYLFLTLTVKNVLGCELSGEIDKLFNGFNKMTERKEFKRISQGWFRCLEVTYKWDRNDYHPHFHMIIAVKKSYFTNDDYMSHDKWKELWRSCAGLDYDPWVDVRSVKPQVNSAGEIVYAKAVAEVSKYAVKSSDFLKDPMSYGIKDEDKLKAVQDRMDSVVKVLDKALAYRRLYAFGGYLRVVHKKLNLESPDEGDLINVDGEVIRSDLNYMIERYEWSIGLSNYILVSEE